MIVAKLVAAGFPEGHSGGGAYRPLGAWPSALYGEITERYLVQETGLLHAVSFHKGCYLARRSWNACAAALRSIECCGVWRSTLPNRRRPESNSNLARRTPLRSRCGFSPALGKTVALAYVRTQFAEPGTKMLLGVAAIRSTRRQLIR